MVPGKEGLEVSPRSPIAIRGGVGWHWRFASGYPGYVKTQLEGALAKRQCHPTRSTCPDRPAEGLTRSLRADSLLLSGHMSITVVPPPVPSERTVR